MKQNHSYISLPKGNPGITCPIQCPLASEI